MTHLAEHTDFIYFLSSLLIVALPLTVFSVLTYLLVKAYFKRKRGTRNAEVGTDD